MAQLTAEERKEAKQHITIALGELRRPLPETHEELIEKFRDYFSDMQIDVFSKMIVDEGEEAFREFIAETLIESGRYRRDSVDGQIRPRN